MQTKNLSRITVLAFLLICLQAGAQEAATPADDAPIIPADEFDRGTPLRSANGFLAAVDVADYETAAEYLDLRNLRGQAGVLSGAQLSRRLFVIIRRATWVDVGELVDRPDGRANDNLPEYRDSIGVVLDGDKEVRLLMQKVPRGDGVFIWKVSNATVSLIPKLYATYGYPEFIEDLRRSLPNFTFLGYELFKWVITLGVGLGVYLAIVLLALVARRVRKASDSPARQRIFRFLVRPFGIWVVVMSMNAVASSLGRGVTAETMERVSPIPILVTVWMMFSGFNLLQEVVGRRLQQQDRPGTAVLLRPVSNALRILVLIGAALIYMDKLGINITTVLAGLGVGGIAVALALQKPMEDVFGAITLYSQQPVRVGDFCRVGDETGTIEEIGLRTTRLRTLANTLIAIPNGRLANEPIDNISAREKILYRPTLRLRYDTKPQQLTQILDGIRAHLGSHDRILQANHRVRFKEIADDALLIEVYAYLDTKDWSVYLELAEELNMKILDIVEQAGTTLSLPARTLHIEQTVPGSLTALT